MKQPLKIKVGLPSYSGRVFPDTAETIKSLSLYDDIEFDISIIPGLSTALARNVSLTNSRKLKQHFDFDYFLSMDDDISFPVSAVLMLLDRNLDIVSASYPMRSNISGGTLDRLTCGTWKDFVGHAPRESYLSVNSSGLVSCDTVGLGCCLIKRKVFETMKYPFFRNHVIENAGEGYYLAEDLSFCLDAANAGFSIYCDCDVRVQHYPGNEVR